MLVETGHDLEESEKEMLTSIFGLSETLAREIMVPRVDMVAVDVTTSLERVLELCAERGLSRLPVYRGSIDEVVGVVLTKDLLGVVRENRLDTPLHELLRPAHFVPGSKKVDELMREMQREKFAMAIVVDEYGGTDGLITMEDLVEEIVGEITDEYDQEAPHLEVLEDGAVLVERAHEHRGCQRQARAHPSLAGVRDAGRLCVWPAGARAQRGGEHAHRRGGGARGGGAAAAHHAGAGLRRLDGTAVPPA